MTVKNTYPAYKTQEERRAKLQEHYIKLQRQLMLQKKKVNKVEV